jgi:hypothetical protein
MRITFESDGKAVEYYEDNVTYDVYASNEVDSEVELTWGHHLVKFMSMLGTHGYYVPDSSDLIKAIDLIQKEKFEALFDKDNTVKEDNTVNG